VLSCHIRVQPQVAANDDGPTRELQQAAASNMEMLQVLRTTPPVVVADPPVPRCCDIQPGTGQDQVWICDTQSGWYPNQAAANHTNPANEVCCLVSCHAIDGLHVKCLALSVAFAAQCFNCNSMV
jgi:hypothetical protein